ncbi:glycosyltransferase family 2 protein [Candidatus Uhrbacteria bacterium]|nr:glycosyltransferase family 2 protein [Candidatus Uhrbacteria bacterium]
MSSPRVAVSVVSYNHGRFLKHLFESLKLVSWPSEAWKIFLVDNASNDDTLALAKNELIDEARGVVKGAAIPATLIALSTNTGFTGANNLVMRRMLAEGYDYVFLLNPDTVVTPEFLAKAVAGAEGDDRIGVVQSLLLVEQSPDRVNSWGNEVHYLGFSFCGGYGVDKNSPLAKQHLVWREIPSASGAAMLLRRKAIEEVGMFDEWLFAYHDDVDLCWRIRLAGFRVMFCPDSVVYHHYEFSRSIAKYYFMERNRFWVQAKLLRIRTLFLIALPLVAMEFGLWFMAARSGWWREKGRAYRDFLSLKTWKQLSRERKKAQQSRRIPDRAVVKFFSPFLRYQETRNALWEHFGDLWFGAFWRLARWMIRW